jgi:hypothetical protein
MLYVFSHDLMPSVFKKSFSFSTLLSFGKRSQLKPRQESMKDDPWPFLWHLKKCATHCHGEE